MNARAHGFTLIEMLVAVAILGMVVAIGSFGYAVFARHWSTRAGHFAQAEGELRRLDLVMRAVEDTLPYIVRNDAGRPGFYFLGRDEGVTLVSARPVFTADGDAVIRLFREPAGAGRWNLVYEEAPLAGVSLRRAQQTLPFSHRMIVLRDLPRIEFAFYGWASLASYAQALASNQAPSWYAAYDGLATGLHPERLALRFGSNEVVVFMPARAQTAVLRYAEQT